MLLCAAAVVLTALCAYLMNVRLYKASESCLATLRVRGFRHVHDLSVLTQNAERRGALVSRVTGDVDQISAFMQSGGLMIIIALGQLLVATVLMFVYSWQLALLVWALLPAARWWRCRASSGGSRGPTRGSASASATCSPPSARRSWARR